MGVVSRTFNPLYSDESHDLGLYLLATEVTDVAPLELNPVLLGTTDLGRNIRHVGYGVSDSVNQTGSGTKRTGLHPVLSVSALEGPPARRTSRSASATREVRACR